MEQVMEISEESMEMIRCSDAASTYPILLFCAIMVLLATYIRSRERLSIVETFQALSGRRKIERNFIINALTIIGLVLPGMIWFALVQDCRA